MNSTAETVRDSLYLDLLKRCLTNHIFRDVEEQQLVEIRPGRGWKKVVTDMFARRGIKLCYRRPFEVAKRDSGRDWPWFAHTMIGRRRLDNIQFCMENVLEQQVSGDFIEAGVWRGGATIFMRAVLKHYGVCDRRVWVADSFEGLPRANTALYPNDTEETDGRYKDLVVSIEDVKRNFESYGLLDEQVKFLKGWFSETLPNAPIDRLAIMRVDGDMYESTWDALSHLYPKLSSGGYVILDDYGGALAARRAVDDFQRRHSIRDEIVDIDGIGAYWRKTS